MGPRWSRCPVGMSKRCATLRVSSVETPVETPVGAVYVREKLERFAPQPQPTSAGIPDTVVIVGGGGGGAGNAAAEMLRQEGYGGRITMLSADEALPCDRPKLSKDYLAGVADEPSTLLRSPASTASMISP